MVDPDDVSNQAFLIDASDATEHMHNHLETTLAGGAQILAGVEYDVVFNAKWISGSPQLNTRAYFNQLAATTIVDTPSLAGTPGGPNSTVVANVGPDLRQLRHSPLVPTSTDDVTIAIAADDVDGVGTVTLHYEFEGVAFTESMALSDGSYRATIPALVDGTTVRFYVEAEDSHGVKSFFPPTGPESHAMYRVDGDGALDVDSHSIRLIMTEADVDWMHREENVMSNHRIGSTVIYNDSEIYYDVGVRLRASGYGRRGARVGFSFQFHPDHLFRDTFKTVVIDRGTVLSNGDATGVQGVAGASPHELLFHQIANRAGGITGNLDDLVFLDAPRNQNTGFGQLKMERYSDEYLSSQFANGDEGDLYKYELIYFADSTIDGNPESMKRSPNNVLGVDISDMGDQKEPYRWNYLKKNRRAVDDYSRVIDLATTLFATQSPARTRVVRCDRRRPMDAYICIAIAHWNRRYVQHGFDSQSRSLCATRRQSSSRLAMGSRSRILSSHGFPNTRNWEHESLQDYQFAKQSTVVSRTFARPNSDELQQFVPRTVD